MTVEDNQDTEIPDPPPVTRDRFEIAVKAAYAAGWVAGRRWPNHTREGVDVSYIDDRIGQLALLSGDQIQDSGIVLLGRVDGG